jgi:tryptophan synthase beta chain
MIALRPATNTPGTFGEYGGRYVPETLIPALDDLERGFLAARRDPAFQRELSELLSEFAGRPTPLMRARSLSERCGARVYLKREDLLHTGAHKLNNTLGQCLLARRMGKSRVIAETGAGQHGVATAAACAKLGLACEVFMGALDVERQAPNVQRMKLLGARVHPVVTGSRTLKDAMNEALRDWVTHVRTTFYCLGSVAGPHPYPSLVRDLQRVIGDEARAQILEREGALPAAVVACIGGGSNAMGIFTAFKDDPSVRLWGVEAAGDGLATGRHAASLARGKTAILHGSRSSVLQDASGQVAHAHSISAGLDYPGVGPELAAMRDAGRLSLASATDEEALAAFARLCKEEGILPALESSHALARLADISREHGANALVVVSLSGRGDKDLTQAEAALDRLGGAS